MAAKIMGKDDGPDCQIISGVLEGVKQSFIDSGVDLEVLSMLKELWVTKLRYEKVKDGNSVGSRPRNQQNHGKVQECFGGAGVLDKKYEAGEDISDEVVIVTDSDIDEQETGRKSVKIIQVDGLVDSSDDDDADDDDEEGGEDGDDDDDLDPDGEEEEGIEDEPLGSDDDIPDEDASELFETDNVMVCQYDKVTRARNKWKFHLKSLYHIMKSSSILE